MNILVYDVAASTSGALAVLEDFYGQVKKYTHKDIKWFFIVSTKKLKSVENITVKCYPWVKKSWFHRIFFEYFIIQKVIRELKIDLIFSMQNIIIPFTQIKQTVYVHLPMAFTDYKLRFKENKILWFYQNILCYKIYKSIRQSYKVIVQTEWMKQACIDKTKCDGNKIVVVKPYIEFEKVESQSICDNNSIITLFYPATAFEYKKHFDILESLKILKEKQNNKFKLILTITGYENRYAKKIRNYIKKYDLHVELIGNVDRSKIFQIYKKSLLIFPSEVESFGMPLLEAKMMNSIIFSKNTKFAREILCEYKNASFFSTIEELVILLENVQNYKVVYVNEEYSVNPNSLVKEIIN